MFLPCPVSIDKGKALFSAEKGMTSLIEGAGMTYQVPERSDDPWKHVRGML